MSILQNCKIGYNYSCIRFYSYNSHMQLKPSQSNIVEKVLRNSDGRLVCATFCVYENGSHIKARLLKVVFLDELVALSNKPFSLTGFSSHILFSIFYSQSSSYKSPYFNKNILDFSGSKPRAPTYTK